MYPDTTFLKDQAVGNFRKNRCIFSGHEFQTKLLDSKTGEEGRGSGYHQYDQTVTRRKHLISDLDLYVFGFEFTKDSSEQLKEAEAKTEVYLRTHKEQYAKSYRNQLESELENTQIPEQERGIAVNAIITQYLDDLKQGTGHFFSGNHYPTRFATKVGELFHNLTLRDLRAISENSGDPENTSDCIITYAPMGLKSHIDAWPFEHFEGETTFTTKFKNLYDPIMLNPSFEGFWMRYPQFGDQRTKVLNLEIEINAKKYNPADHI